MTVHQFPKAGFRRFVGPAEAAERRRQEERGEIADVIAISGGPNDQQPVSPLDRPVNRTDEEALNRLARKGFKPKRPR